MADAYVGIGSNLGDRSLHLIRALDEMEGLPQTKMVAMSGVYETEPVGPPGQASYLNAVARLDTQLSPDDLLRHLQIIEEWAGRIRDQRWGPRTLDLDLLLYDSVISDSDFLTLPHPHAHERWFVLKPLCDLNPNLKHPLLQLSVAEMLNRLPAHETGRAVRVPGYATTQAV